MDLSLQRRKEIVAQKAEKFQLVFHHSKNINIQTNLNRENQEN
jgi:hypothetical protein